MKKGTLKNSGVPFILYAGFLLRSRSKITFTFPQFSRMLLCLPFATLRLSLRKVPICYILSGMRLIGKPQNHRGIFRGTCQVYLFTTLL
jgi:hypothetical protein